MAEQTKPKREGPARGAQGEPPRMVGGEPAERSPETHDKPMTPRGQPHEEGPVHDVTDAEGPGSPGGLGKEGRARPEGGRDPHDLRRRAELGEQSPDRL